PDGLEKVATDHGIAEQAEEHAAENSPLAGYQTSDIGDPRLSGGLAGVVGVGATLAVGSAVFWVVRRRPQAGDDSGVGDDSTAGQDTAPAAAAQGGER
ncbi:MAG TPA: cobalt ABC transporter, partial [Streptomyces sp.]|nr:cobalt ABC transporter [Streptomyces sp.]